jgi:hypothetical protein
MKNFLSAVFILILVCAADYSALAACENEPTLAATGEILREIKVPKAKNQNAAAELYLTLKARVPNASWQTKGAEAAVVTVFVDGAYNQDLILFAGAENFEYRAFLGAFDRSVERKVALVLNEKRSAPNARAVKIQRASVAPFAEAKSASVFERLARLNAPVIYLRPDTIDKFSDVPLLTYYEIFDDADGAKRIRYTTVFSNEDGGTLSQALMARWGRITDIEWVYEMRVGAGGEILSEIYQGARHETKVFTGKRGLGVRPLIFNQTVNNNFADAGCAAVRVSPPLVGANLFAASRESLMDAFPWTYRVMTEEAIRENRVNRQNLGANIIADPRDYLYVDIETDLKNASVALEIISRNGAKISSDENVPAQRMSRRGFNRIAVRLPETNGAIYLPESVNVRCFAASGDGAAESVCAAVKLIKAVRLDASFRLREIKFAPAAAVRIKPGEAAEFKIL